jgi:hypothetical protein
MLFETLGGELQPRTRAQVPYDGQTREDMYIIVLAQDLRVTGDGEFVVRRGDSPVLERYNKSDQHLG